TLLFAHANGFCKETWDPVIRRLKQSPMLQQAVEEYVTYDQPFQASNRDESVLGEVYYKDDKPSSPRVKHPLNNWPDITAEAAYQQVQRLNVAAEGGPRRPLIGIGHSMGAAALWATEARHPGTFNGLILFEPIYGETDAAYNKSVDFLVSITLARDNKWYVAGLVLVLQPTVEAAVSHFENWNNFASWDRESLASWIKGGVVYDETQQAAVLACHPQVEAAVYSGPRLCLTESELAAPQCPVTFHSGSRTRLFDRDVFERLADQHPGVYTTHPPLPNTSHLLVFEDPAASTAAILTDLEKLSPFQPGSAHL
ncbi:hypothetical protein BBJ28_00026460, partial [Nothophytophthora sp. Chile5]